MVLINGKCSSGGCPKGYKFDAIKRFCYLDPNALCPGEMIEDLVTGLCKCPSNSLYVDGDCQKIVCPDVSMTIENKVCRCPSPR